MLKITLTEQEAREHIIFKGFYDFITTKTGRTISDNLMYDCTKICITPKLQDLWYEHYKNEGVPTIELTMALANSGPKANINIDDYIVEVEDAFFCTK